MISDNTEHRFWKYALGWRPDICWEWQGARDMYGYGILKADGRDYKKAHRIAYQIFHGPIPEGHVIRHKCDNKPCVNPSHLESGTHRDNVKDAISRGLRSNTCRRCDVTFDAQTDGCSACSKRHRARAIRLVAAMAKALQ